MRRLLVVDDETVIAMATTEALLDMGLAVVTAFDLATARDLVTSEPFDLILCDLFLRPGTGLDLLNAVEHAELATPFVLMSATRSVDMDWILTGRARIAAFLPKPFTPSTLANVIQSVLARADARE